MRPPTLVLVLLLAAAAPAPAAEEKKPDLETPRKAAVAKLVRELHALALWCQEQNLLLFRDRCAEVIVRFDEEDVKAHRWLKFHRTRDGKWVRRLAYKPPANKPEDEAVEAEFEPRFRAILDEFVTTLVGIVEPLHEVEPSPGARRVLADVFKVDPDHEKARSLNGEARHGGKWVLKESARALGRRKELRDAADRILAAIPEPKEVPPTPFEAKLGVTWRSHYRGVWWRALGTVEKDELRLILRSADAARPFLSEALKIDFRTPKDCAFYLLTGPAEAAVALKADPRFTEAQRARFLKLAAAWVPRTRSFYQYSDSPEVRHDGVTRMSIGLLLLDKFGITTEKGWAWEGFGLLLDYLLTGTRKTFYVMPGPYTTTKRPPHLADLKKRMKQGGSNWLSLAGDLVEAKLAPELRPLSRRTVNELSAPELLYSYALASYILEGRPDQAAPFLVVYGSGARFEDAVERVFHISVDELQNRLARYLREVG